MKEQGEFEKRIVIEQMPGGYIVTVGIKSEIHPSFSSVVNYLARSFDLVKIGENILLQTKNDS